MHGEVTEEFLNDVTWKGLTETLREWGSEDLEQIEDDDANNYYGSAYWWDSHVCSVLPC